MTSTQLPAYFRASVLTWQIYILSAFTFPWLLFLLEVLISQTGKPNTRVEEGGATILRWDHSKGTISHGASGEQPSVCSCSSTFPLCAHDPSDKPGPQRSSTVATTAEEGPKCIPSVMTRFYQKPISARKKKYFQDVSLRCFSGLLAPVVSSTFLFPPQPNRWSGSYFLTGTRQLVSWPEVEGEFILQ